MKLYALTYHVKKYLISFYSPIRMSTVSEQLHRTCRSAIILLSSKTVVSEFSSIKINFVKINFVKL